MLTLLLGVLVVPAGAYTSNSGSASHGSCRISYQSTVNGGGSNKALAATVTERSGCARLRVSFTYASGGRTATASRPWTYTSSLTASATGAQGFDATYRADQNSSSPNGRLVRRF